MWSTLRVDLGKEKKNMRVNTMQLPLNKMLNMTNS